MTHEHDNERGSAMVESVFGIAIILMLAMGVLTLTQAVWTHLDLSSTTRDVARYAARVEYDPSPSSGSVSASRHRTEDQIAAYAQQAGKEAGVTVTSPCTISNGKAVCGDVTISPADPDTLRTGDEITVTITKTVSNPLYKVGAAITNAAATVFHVGHPFNENGLPIKSEATSYVE